MENESEALRPDSIIYNLVMDAHAKTSSRKAHIKARNVLDTQMAMYKSGVARKSMKIMSVRIMQQIIQSQNNETQN